MEYKKNFGWYLVSFNPEYHIYPDFFHLGQQFGLKRYWQFLSARCVKDCEADTFTVYHENGDIGKSMSRCQGEWIKITNKEEYNLAKMLYPSINFEVDYELLPCN